METLVCAATEEELRTYGDATRQDICLLVTGVGIPCALATVLQALQNARPSHILNIGIAGAYPKSGLSIGDIVTASSEVYGDIGFELPESPHFRSLQDAPFGAFYQEPFTLIPVPNVPVGRGCTVNACAGSDATGESREALFGATFETMEGAAIAHAGQIFGLPVSEVRAISNIAARRAMHPENIRCALVSLTQFFQENPYV
jgi:futalosine hydrolase